MASTFRTKFLSGLEEGTSIKQSAKAAAGASLKQIRKDYSPKGMKEKFIQSAFGGDTILDAYIRGKVGVKKKTKKDKGPTPEGKEGQSLDSQGVTFIKIIAKNSISIPGMARDMNVMRQNIQKLVKLRGGKAKGRADAFFLKEDERESLTESQRESIQRAKDADFMSGRSRSDGGEGGILDSIIGMFTGGFTKGIKSLFSPKMLGNVLKKVFLPIAIIGTLFSGIMDGWKRYQETGNFGDAIVAGLGGMLNFLSFGLFGEDTLKSLWSSVSDFLSPITDTIGEIFTGIKNFFVKLFGGKVEEKTSGKIEKTKPNMPDPKEFAVQAAKAGGADEQKAQDLGSIFDAVKQGDAKSMFAKAQEFAQKYPEEPKAETSPTPTTSEGIPADQAQRNYELNKQLTGEASKALGVDLPMSPSPVTSPAPTTPAPTPAASLSNEEKIKELEGNIERNKRAFAKREAAAKRHVESLKKRYPDDPERVKEIEDDYKEYLEKSERPAMEAANAEYQKQIDVLKKSPSVSSGSSESAAAPSTTPTESGSSDVSSGGAPSLESAGGPSVSGSEVSSESSQVSEGQRMESAADQGSVVNAPTNNSSTTSPDNIKPPAAPTFNIDFNRMLRMT